MEARVNALVKTNPLVLLATASAASAQTKNPVDDVDTRSGHPLMIPRMKAWTAAERPSGSRNSTNTFTANAR